MADNISIPTKTSGAERWVQYHKTLEDTYGLEKANRAWTKAWDIRGSSDANTSTLRDYMEKKGVNVEAGTMGSIYDVGETAVSGIGNTVGSILNFGRTTTYVVLGVAGVAVIGIAYGIASNPEGAADLAKTAATRGRA